MGRYLVQLPPHWSPHAFSSDQFPPHWSPHAFSSCVGSRVPPMPPWSPCVASRLLHGSTKDRSFRWLGECAISTCSRHWWSRGDLAYSKCSAFARLRVANCSMVGHRLRPC